MSSQYRPAFIVLVIGMLPLAASLFAGTWLGWALLLPAVALPIAILLAIRAAMGLNVSVAAALGGALVAPPIAIVGESILPAYAFAFFLGFATSGRTVLEALRVDPQLATALSSPWTIVLLVDVAVVAPFVEEAAKALGASFARPQSREQAFLAGVTAGCAFAAVENIIYVAFGGLFSGPWVAIATVRMLGAAVHPLATGLTMLGYHEWRARGAGGALVRGYLSAVGVHALWNGTITLSFVVVTAIFESGTPSHYGVIALCYAAALGVALAGALWQVTRSVLEQRQRVLSWDLNSGEGLAAWTLLASTLLIPVSILLLAFPSFYRG
jgi:RsiW-degrading membrane proteinase PrsW (M82 family)